MITVTGKKLPYVFNLDKISRILGVIRGEKQKECWKDRDSLMVLLGCEAGLRENEVANLKLSDVNLEEGILKVNWQGAKLNKERMIVLTDKLKDGLQSYLMKYSGRLKDYLFSTRFGHISTVWIRARFQAYLKKAGLYETYGVAIDSRPLTKYHFHTLRHTFGTTLIEKGVDPFTVAELMGHANILSTQTYIHTSMKLKREAIKKAFGQPHAAQGEKQVIDPELICPHCQGKVYFNIVVEN